ncbi:hypothetical protein DUI87_03895 [Hirundo rustica rustica]|uniref:Integrase zinc-binding domain-containing protein n=1 Tax=Hirundo rustica rustica TaxID=333673 RepID=A0A3M0L1F7_HIRRU|nr:hypothetical protein DUI87_03895 [Hirundo rustica rustica]
MDLSVDNISQVIHNCETCAAIKQAKRVKPLWYGGRWLKYRYGEAWQIDYITLPQTHQGKRYVLTMVEVTTGWLETYPVPHATAWALKSRKNCIAEVYWNVTIHNNGEKIILVTKNLHTCVGNEKPVSPKILINGKEEYPTLEMESAHENVSQPKSPVKKDDLLKKARDVLAEEIAKSVISESPDSVKEKGMALDDLISSLSFNPFLTRKQIPRTPENLLTEIRSSWRKAIQTEGSLDLELSSTQVVTEESSMDAIPRMQGEVDSTFAYSDSASPVSDFGPVSEKKSQLSSTESISQDQVSVSHALESSDSKPSGIQESERTESEELDCSALSGSSVENLSQTLQNTEKSLNIPDTCLKSSSRASTLLSDWCCSFPVDEMLWWNESVLNSVDHETSDMGILDETLPESDGIDLSISAGSDSVFYAVDSENLTDGSENNDDIKKLDLDIQSLSNSHDVLKRTASKSEEELHQTHNGGKSESCRAEVSTIPEEGDDNDGDPAMDEGFAKMPLPSAPNESKYSLSSLLVSCQQMDGT